MNNDGSYNILPVKRKKYTKRKRKKKINNTDKKEKEDKVKKVKKKSRRKRGRKKKPGPKKVIIKVISTEIIKTKKNYYKKKVGRHKKCGPKKRHAVVTPYTKINTQHYRSVKKMNELYGDIVNNDDYLYSIISNCDLLNKHVTYIYYSKYKHFKFEKCTVPSGEYAGLSPRLFIFFKEHYRPIYNRWIHIIRSCFDPAYKFYKYFGGKGIYASKTFLDSRLFCIWCLNKGIYSDLKSYTQYIQRVDKSKDFSRSNCFIISEDDLYKSNNLKLAFSKIILAKSYKEIKHSDDITFWDMYTRYYIYDMNIYDSLIMPYTSSTSFKYKLFYKSVASKYKDCCNLSTYIMRVNQLLIIKCTIFNPYDLLKQDFSVSEYAALQGKLTYHEQNKNKRSSMFNSMQYNNNDDIYNDMQNVYNKIN